jgi:hypothetical protein
MSEGMNGQPPTMEQPPAGKQPPAEEQPSASTHVQELVQQLNGGASWFFVIAVLSIVNSVLMFAGTTWTFIFGLGITQIIDGLAMGVAQAIETGAGVWIVRAIGLAFNLGIAGFFILFGWLARKGYGVVFIIGMLLYLFDGLLLLLFMDILGLGFHAFALFLMFRGYSALRQLRALQAEQPVVP